MREEGVNGMFRTEDKKISCFFSGPKQRIIVFLSVSRNFKTPVIFTGVFLSQTSNCRAKSSSSMGASQTYLPISVSGN